MKYGFTLAEVLITLGIIGIIAALTIPSIVTGYQKKVTVESLKKVYSSLSQAVKLSEAENGFVSDWNIGAGHNLFVDYLLPYLNSAENCVLSECKSRGIYFGLEGNKFVVPAGPNSIDSLPGGDTQTWIVVLADGTMLYAYQSLYHNYVIVRLFVDINGNKGPNKIGRDIFCLLFLTDSLFGASDIADTIIVRPGIYFEGFGLERTELVDNSKYHNCNKKGYAFTCGALIQHDGWKIPKDYPW